MIDQQARQLIAALLQLRICQPLGPHQHGDLVGTGFNRARYAVLQQLTQRASRVSARSNTAAI